MALKLSIDFETYSEVDLSNMGAYMYAQDQTTEVLCACWQLYDGATHKRRGEWRAAYRDTTRCARGAPQSASSRTVQGGAA